MSVYDDLLFSRSIISIGHFIIVLLIPLSFWPRLFKRSSHFGSHIILMIYLLVSLNDWIFYWLIFSKNRTCICSASPVGLQWSPSSGRPPYILFENRTEPGTLWYCPRPKNGLLKNNSSFKYPSEKKNTLARSDEMIDRNGFFLLLWKTKNLLKRLK